MRGTAKMMVRVAPNQLAPKVYDMYIYDDVKAKGAFDWDTWRYLDSETSANYFREQLAQIPEDATINLYINSNGGDVKEGVGIYNQLKRHGATVNGVVDGNAYSVAFLILMACDKKVMNLGTSALVHNMWMNVSGNATELRQAADDLDKLMESNRQIFLDACNNSITEEKLIELMEAETFLTPDECLAYGFIDEIGNKRTKEGESIELMQLREANAQMQKEIESLKQQLSGGDPNNLGRPGQTVMEQETIDNIFGKYFR